MQKTGMGYFKMGFLGLQHMFAMFGATILVPLLSGLSVQVTLVSVGLGTLLFHFCTKSKIPAFLGSSFAFLVGIQLITDPVNGIYSGSALSMQDKLAYATGGIMVSGAVYLLFALLIKLIGVKKFMQFLPPIVTAPTVILIGIILAPFAISQSLNNIFLAALTLGIIIAASSWGKGMVKIIPILLGIGIAYIVAVVLHNLGIANPDGTAMVDFSRTAGASVAGIPPFFLPKFDALAIVIMIPFALATIAEHVGDMTVLSTITGKDFLEEPGLSRTLIGDGLASSLSGLIGGPANTTYGENVGVVALTKIFNPRVVQLAAVYAIVLGFSPLFAGIIHSIPPAIIGGASFMLYGMIAAVGVRNLVEHRVDMSKTKNLTIVGAMLVTGLGLQFGPSVSFTLVGGEIPINGLGLAIAVILGIVLNLVLPNEKGEEV